MPHMFYSNFQYSIDITVGLIFVAIILKLRFKWKFDEFRYFRKGIRYRMNASNVPTGKKKKNWIASLHEKKPQPKPVNLLCDRSESLNHSSLYRT